MADPGEINADMLAFWNGKGGRIWVARQAHTDSTLTPVTDALLAFAAPRAGERMLDVGCGCGAPTLEFARAVGPSGRVAGLDISGPMLAEGERRAKAAGLANVDWRQADPATAALDEYDLLTSAFGTMFFGDRVAAFTNCAALPLRCAHGDRVLAYARRKPVDGGADDRGRAPPATAAETGPDTPPECSPSPTPSASLRFSLRPPGRRRASRSSMPIWISPPAAGWRRLSFSRRRSAR